MLLKTFLLQTLVVTCIFSLELLQRVSEINNYKDILFIYETYDEIHIELFQKNIKNKKSNYKSKNQVKVKNCFPSFAYLYIQNQGDLQFAVQKRYNVQDLYKKMIDLEDTNKDNYFQLKATCTQGQLQIYIQKFKYSSSKFLFKVDQDQENHNLTLIKQEVLNEKFQEVSNQKKILALSQNVQSVLQQIEILYVCSFRYSQHKSLRIQLDKKQDLNFEQFEYLAPSVSQSYSAYDIVDNKIKAVVIDIQEKQSGIPICDNSFCRDPLLILPIIFKFTLNLMQNEIQVNIQQIGIDETYMLRYDNFLNCKYQIENSFEKNKKTLIRYTLEHSQDVNFYTIDKHEIDYSLSFKDYHYAYSDVPFIKKKTHCQIKFYDLDQDWKVIEIIMSQQKLDFDEYKYQIGEVEIKKSQVLQESDFDQELNNELENEQQNLPYFTIKQNKLYFNHNKKSFECKQIFTNKQVKTIEQFNVVEFVQFIWQTENQIERNLHWFQYEQEKRSQRFYEQQSISNFYNNFQNLQECKILNVGQDKLQIYLRLSDQQLDSNEVNIFKIESNLEKNNNVENQGIYKVGIYNEENKLLLKCQKQLEFSTDEQQYYLEYSYIDQSGEQKYFFQNRNANWNQKTVIFQNNIYDIKNNKGCFIDDTVLKENKYLSVVIFDKPQQGLYMHYIKVYFQQEVVMVFETKFDYNQKEIQIQTQKPINSLNYQNSSHVYFVSNFGDDQNNFKQELIKKVDDDSIDNSFKKESINFQQLAYFSNQVQIKDQTYVQSIIHHERIQYPFYLLSIQKENSQHQAWVAVIFHKKDKSSYLRAFPYVIQQSTNSILDVQDYGMKSLRISSNEQYTFKLNLQEFELTTNQKLIFDNPIVLLSQPFKYNHFQKKIVYQDKALIFDKNDYKINLDLKIENKKRKKVI